MSTDPATVAATRLELLKDPEYRKARLAQIRCQSDRRLSGAGGGTRAVRRRGRPAIRPAGRAAVERQHGGECPRCEQSGRTDHPAGNRAHQQEARRKRQESLTAMLGADRFGQWQQYQQTLPARTQATAQLTSMLAAAGQPATSTQLQPVASAMAAEQRRQTEELQSLFRGAEPWTHRRRRVYRLKY